MLSCLVTAADSVPILLSVLRSIRLSILFEWDRRLRTLVTKKSPDAAPADEAYLLVGQSTDKDDACHSTSPLSDGRNDGTLDEIDMLNSNGTFYEEHNSKSTSWTPKNSKRHRHIVQHSLGSDHSTLHEELPTPSTPKPRVTIPQRILIVGQFFLMILERCLVPYAWGQSLSGFSVYFGLGHTYYINGVLAHFISMYIFLDSGDNTLMAAEGSIFWWFGILTFARYLGAWSRWGWAWNIPPHNSRTLPWSASFVESLVIFLYGFSQQFMERFGTHPGDPYSAKDVEHISIAVMFWAGGLVGMAIETPTIRKWLQGETDTRYFHSRSRRKHSSSAIDMEVTDSLAASNPLPALVIGITGIAMSAHHQTYQFQVQIHALWGYLLLGFAICRCLTCFFEWVRPERRMPMLPSMPPTELLGSIFLGAGGIAFICSDEEITLWAMRTHRGAVFFQVFVATVVLIASLDDAMMFLNLSIAVTCVAYVWCTFVLTIGGKTRSTDRRL